MSRLGNRRAAAWLLPTGLLALGITGGAAVYLELSPAHGAVAATTRPPTVEVKRSPIAATVVASGSIAPAGQSRLAFRSAGRVKDVLVAAGDGVAEGQPLATLDTAEFELAAAQAQTQLNLSLARMEAARAGARPEDVRAAEAALAAASVKLHQTQVAAGGGDLTIAEQAVKAARIKLTAALGGGRAEDVAAARAAVDAAQAKLAALQAGARPEDERVALAQLAQAQARLAQAQTPHPEDVAAAEAALDAARQKLALLLNPRPEDLAAAQSVADQAQTKLAQLLDAPRVQPQDIANAQLAVRNAQAAVDKARAEDVGPIPAVHEANIRQAQIALETAQNNLGKLLNQAAADWDIRLQQEQVAQAEAALQKLTHPSEADVQGARAAAAQAEATLQKLRSPTPLDLQALQAAVDQAQANLDKVRSASPYDVLAAQAAVDQAQALLKRLLSPDDFDVQAAQVAVDQAQAALERTRRAQGFDVETAQAQLDQARANLDLKRAGPAAQDVAVAQAQVEVAQAQLDQAKWTLANATLAAPFAGIVGAVSAGAGEVVGANNPVVTLVDRRAMRADVAVDEADAVRIKPGQPATLSFDLAPGRTARGRVAGLVPLPSLQQGLVSYVVQIGIEGVPEVEFLPGMSALAQIVTDSRDGALVIPSKAIHGAAGGKERTVQVLGADGRPATRTVKTGLAADQFTEVIDGLREGDRVVVPPALAK